MLKEPKYSPKNLQLQWLNNIHQSHDLFCGCEDTILHLLCLINSKGNAPKPEKDVRNIKCLLTGDTTKDTGEEDGIFEEGLLEKLFSEDAENGDTTEETG